MKGIIKKLKKKTIATPEEKETTQTNSAIQRIESEDIYSEESINEFVENDLISTRESAFMQGYFAAGGY